MRGALLCGTALSLSDAFRSGLTIPGAANIVGNLQDSHPGLWGAYLAETYWYETCLSPAAEVMKRAAYERECREGWH